MFSCSSRFAIYTVWPDPDGNQHVPVLNDWNGKRKLDLNWFDNDWNDNYRFAAVRESVWNNKELLAGFRPEESFL